jgi:molybdopterin-containing oxidoreductase family iron-sulfur binding subunit
VDFERAASAHEGVCTCAAPATHTGPVDDDGPDVMAGLEPTTRRTFLKDLAKGFATLGVAGAVAPMLMRFSAEAAGVPLRPPGIRQKYVMVFDLRVCDGCKDCTTACRKMHGLPEDFEFIRVYDLESSAGRQFYMPIPCMMCQSAPCYRVCPTGATFYSDDGLVLIDQDQCIGCRACIAACPYHARYFNYDQPPAMDPAQVPFAATPAFPGFQKKGTVGKCAFCAHLLRKGELPACVSSCTMGAIYIGEWDKDLATNGRETVQLSSFLGDNDAFRFKEDQNSQPSVYYVAGHGQNLSYY